MQLAERMTASGDASGAVVLDDFLPDPIAVRDAARKASFDELREMGGALVLREARASVQALQERIEEAVGCPIALGAHYFQLALEGETDGLLVGPRAAGGTHVLILHLAERPGGVCFWKHRTTGVHRVNRGDGELLGRICLDSHSSENFESVRFEPLTFNRAVIFESALLHSRYPFDGFGSDPETGSLVLIAEFSPSTDIAKLSLPPGTGQGCSDEYGRALMKH